MVDLPGIEVHGRPVVVRIAGVGVCRSPSGRRDLNPISPVSGRFLGRWLQTGSAFILRRSTSHLSFLEILCAIVCLKKMSKSANDFCVLPFCAPKNRIHPFFVFLDCGDDLLSDPSDMPNPPPCFFWCFFSGTFSAIDRGDVLLPENGRQKHGG